ncbi:hypothetical protein T4D_8038 [Trichinella pseudospiralis]|uniref:Uncharacterized protein n=1 Tax=Trichinella pseudospiralis TaxID=6337 RepID=A0A0V1FIB4_TRIPS|nr:hypothetical protein T4D_8038 [Trichinella pseudospiralis]
MSHQMTNSVSKVCCHKRAYHVNLFMTKLSVLTNSFIKILTQFSSLKIKAQTNNTLSVVWIFIELENPIQIFTILHCLTVNHQFRLLVQRQRFMHDCCDRNYKKKSLIFMKLWIDSNSVGIALLLVILDLLANCTYPYITALTLI